MNIASLFASLGLKIDKSAFEAGDRLIGKIETGLKALMVFEGVKLFTNAIQSTLELGQHIKELSQSTGVSTDALQTMGYAAELSGVSTDSMAHAMGRLARNMYQAQLGSKQSAQAFARIGVSVTDAHGKLKPVDTVMSDISDKFAKMPDGAEKTAIAITLFGRAGAELIPLLDRGGKSLEEMAKEAYDLGIVLDEEAVGKLEEANKSVKRISLALQGFKNQAVIALLPYLQRASEYMLKWLRDNKAEILDKLTRAVEWLGKALGYMAQVVKGVVKFFSEAYAVLIEVVDVISEAADASDTFRYILIAVGSALAVLALAVEAPFLLAAGAIAFLLLIGEDLYSWATGGPSLFKDLWTSISEGHPIIKEIGEALAWLGGIIKDTIHGLGALTHASQERTLTRDIDDRTKQMVAKGKELQALKDARGADSSYDTDLDKKSHAYQDKKIAEKQAEFDKINAELHKDKRAYNQIQDEYNEGEGKYSVSTAAQDKAKASAPYANQALAPLRAVQAAVAAQQNNTINIHVQAGSADAKTVVEMIGDHLTGVLRQAQAQVGKR
jgi:TP901 family phage tail tape measure protein